MDLKDNVRRAYNNFAQYYEKSMMKSYQIFYRKRVESILEKLIQPDWNVLDIGCGTGFPSIYLAKKGCRVTAFDISKNMIKLAEKKAKVEGVAIKYLTLDAAEEYPWEDQHFNAATSIYGSLSCLSDIRPALMQIRRVLKKDGLFIATLYSKHSIFRLTHQADLNRFIEIILSEEPVSVDEFLYKEVYPKTLKCFLYSSADIKKAFSDFFIILQIQGLMFLPSLFAIEDSPRLLEEMEKFLKWEEEFASKDPYIDLGIDVAIVAIRD